MPNKKGSALLMVWVEVPGRKRGRLQRMVQRGAPG